MRSPEPSCSHANQLNSRSHVDRELYIDDVSELDALCLSHDDFERDEIAAVFRKQGGRPRRLSNHDRDRYDPPAIRRERGHRGDHVAFLVRDGPEVEGSRALPVDDLARELQLHHARLGRGPDTVATRKMRKPEPAPMGLMSQR